MRTVGCLISGGALVIGLASLALTAWLWLGDWPQETKEIVDFYRSVGEQVGQEPEPLVANVRGREGVRSLNGPWQAVIDLYGRAELAGMAPRAVRPESPSDLAEFSFEDGLVLQVPGDWNSQDPRLVFYQGLVWYKREFDHPGDAARTFLWFGAGNYRTAVYLNGLLVGEHEGGFTPFNFEVTGGLKPGSNLLVVSVDNRKGPTDVPTPMTDWHNYGGLTRDVLLLDLPAAFVRDYSVRLSADGARIEGFVQVDGAARQATVSIPDLAVEVTVELDGTGRGEFEVAATPERWSPESPKRYRAEVRAGEDLVVDEIGFRVVAAAGNRILLNGEPIYLRGISLHEEAPHGDGRARTEAHARTLLGWAADLGCNFVRLAHYPHNEHMVRVADELGLLVWAEVPVYWNVAFETEAARTRTRRQLTELITRDRNRAAVILWSIGNETPLSEPRNAFMRDMADHVRSLDSSRLVTAALLSGQESLTGFFLDAYVPALLGFSPEVWTYRIDDELADIVDVAAVNEYFGWYYSGALALLTPFSSAHARRVMLDGLDRIRIETGLGKPLILSELGAGAKAGWREPVERLAVYTEDYQALVYERQIAMIREQEDVVGLSPWILKDFRSPLRLYQGVQDYWNRKGLVSDEGERKLAFDVLRDYYRERAAGG